MSKPVSVAGSISITTAGTAVTRLLPYDESAGVFTKEIIVRATGAGATIRLGTTGSTTAVTTDLLVQPGDPARLSVNGLSYLSALAVSGTVKVSVSALSTGAGKPFVAGELLINATDQLLINGAGDFLRIE